MWRGMDPSRAKERRGIFWIMEMFYTFIEWWLHKCMHLSKFMEMHALNGGILIHISYISTKLIILFFKYLFIIYLFWLCWVLVAAHGIFVVACGLLVAACRLLVAACMWDLVPQPGIEPGPPALGAWSLNHWATRKVRIKLIIFKEG